MTDPAPATNPGRRVWLVVLEGARAGTRLLVEDRPVMIGRDPDAQLRMDPQQDRLVSARHAILGFAEGEGWVLRDLDSRNGTWVNGQRVDGRRVVEPGDEIRLGRTGPLVLFTDRDSATPGTLPPRPPTTHRALSAPRKERPEVLVAIGVGVAGLAALVVFWSAWSSPDRAASAGEAPRQAAQVSASPPEQAPDPSSIPAGDPASPDRSESDANRDAVIAALQDSLAGLGAELRRSRQERADLARALEDARERGASDVEVEALRRKLQASDAALRRHQLAASLDFETIGRTARPATAQIYVEFSGGRTIAATAFGVDSRGLLVTNRHVVRNEGVGAVLRIGVQYSGRRELLPAEVVAVSPVADLALVRVTGDARTLPAVTRFNPRADTLATGSPVVLFGFPLGGDSGGADRAAPRPLVSAGILTGSTDAFLEIEGYGRGGASGSPILDASGRVIGVLVGGTTGDEEGGERVFAVPASRLLAFIESVPAAR